MDRKKVAKKERMALRSAPVRPKAKKPAREPQEKTPVTDKNDEGFPIAGIGASAGGLEAFEQFFTHVSPDTGIAFVLVPHLDPSHASMMVELLTRFTRMPVIEAQDHMPVEPNHVYVIAPNRDMAIFHGRLQLSVPSVARGQRMPIDLFLRSLAEDQGHRTVGIIFSGTGTDGTLGLRAVRGAGGVSIVQEPGSAKYDGMPVSAVHSGVADYVLPPDQMAEQLVKYVKKAASVTRALSGVTAEPGSLQKILMLLRSRTGHDFSLYKKNTIHRRIERRMSLHAIDDVAVYVRYLQEHPEEISLLFKELLIGVTSFFREMEAFEVLKKTILPKSLPDKPDDYTFRAWVVGCSTGEEAYSVAIATREYMEEIKQEFKVQIFATDLDDEAIAHARAGLYPANIAVDVSPERLRRFFSKEENSYRIKKEIREMVIFAVQDVTRDAPFTKLDLISCRNLLIYLEAELQGRLLPLFHYSLKPGGMLFLGSSESIGIFTDLFALVDKKWKFYQAKQSISPNQAAIVAGLPWSREQGTRGVEAAVKKTREISVSELAQKTLLQAFAPPSVMVNEQGEILFVYGETGKYLRPAPGQPSLNVLEMAREGLQFELRSALHAAISHSKEVVRRDVQVRTNGEPQLVNLTVRPLSDKAGAQGLLMILFQEAAPVKERKAPGRKGGKIETQGRRVVELQTELMYTRENLQASVEELQASNEELKSSNEELQSTNEELQSTNEEMETSKEELQSLNEELVTVNSELQSKIEQLSQAENDMKNLLDNTNVGTIFLDNDLRIKRFTVAATKLINLIPTDVGRSLGDIVSRFEGMDLTTEARNVLETLRFKEAEVQTKEREWYLVRVMPYRTVEHMIDGVVITFTEITGSKRAAEERAGRLYAEAIVATIRQPLIVLDGDLRVVSANQSFYRTFRVAKEETEGRYIYELGKHQWDIPPLRRLLEEILPNNTFFEDFEVTHSFPVVGERKLLLNGRRIVQDQSGSSMILLAFEDITTRDSALEGPEHGKG